MLPADRHLSAGNKIVLFWGSKVKIGPFILQSVWRRFELLFLMLEMQTQINKQTNLLLSEFMSSHHISSS